MFKALTGGLRSKKPTMTTTPDSDHDKRNRQSRGNSAQVEEIQQVPDLQRDLELQCQQLAEQVANFPSVLRHHMANIEVSTYPTNSAGAVGDESETVNLSGQPEELSP